MAVLDGVLLGILLVSMLLGAWRGLVFELFSLVGWVAGFFIARLFAPDVAAWLAVEVLIVELGREGVVEALQRSAVDPAVSASDGERTRRVLASLGVSRAWVEERWRAELVRRTT